MRLGHAIALKVMRRRHAANPACRERFLREARLAAQFSHPNLIAVLDVGELDDGRPFMVCELARGETLESIMARGRIAPGRTVELLRQICDGLAAAHDLGIVHRDLKPANVIIEREDAQERVRLLDFGIAAAPGREERLTEAGLVVGTPHYMAPEQAKDERTDPRADLYALGVLGFEMIAGARPFQGAGIEVIREKILRVAPRIAECDPVLDRILHRLLERDPADRWPSAAVVGDILARYQAQRDELAFYLGVESSARLPPPVQLWHPRCSPSVEEVSDVGTEAVPGAPAQEAKSAHRADAHSATAG